MEAAVASRGRIKMFGQILSEYGGAAPGFDFVRLFLATFIVLWHSIYYANPPSVANAIWSSKFGPVVNCAVPLFFALSGFLVTGSLLRLRNLKIFVMFRVLRIIPALFVEITVSAILLGAIVTNLPPVQYFSDPQFFSYFSNIVGAIQFELPGVFKQQFYDQVNGALWTVPGEISCYLTLVLLALFGVATRRTLLLMLFITASIGTYIWTRHNGAFSTQNWIPLVFCFYAGSLLFHYAENIPSHWTIAVLAMGAAYYIMQFRFGLYIVFGPCLIAYVVCYFGMQKLPHIKYLMDGDHSYGIYLYHCPVIQTIVWATGGTIVWWQAFLAGYVVVALFSMLSWRFIEKPALSLRTVLSR